MLRALHVYVRFNSACVLVRNCATTCSVRATVCARITTAGIIRTVAATRHQQPAQRRDLELDERRRRHQSDLIVLDRGSFDAL